MVRTSGTIIGKFKRAVSTTGVDYLFPVGTSSYYRPAIFNFSSLSASTNIISQFVAASPGSFTPYADGVTQLDNAYTEGYWNFSSTSLPANTYSITLDGSGFSSYPIDANSRISGRNAGSTTWQAFGVHGSLYSCHYLKPDRNN